MTRPQEESVEELRRRAKVRPMSKRQEASMRQDYGDAYVDALLADDEEGMKRHRFDTFDPKKDIFHGFGS